MSHKATNWAIEQRGLKPAVKILLWHLADRHNKDTGRCDPSQALLAHDCEMSRATVNRHLITLEEAGLIRRISRFCPDTKSRISTYYLLAFDNDLSKPGPLGDDGSPLSQNETGGMSQIETGGMSQNATGPCLKTSTDPVSNCDTNPVREPNIRGRARKALPPDPEHSAKVREKYLNAIVEGRAFLAKHCPEPLVSELLRNEEVTEAQLRKVGLA